MNYKNLKPTVLIDTREQLPLPINKLPTSRGTLISGDYSFLGGEELFCIERKSIGDLVGSVSHGRYRFERELHRLRGFRFKRLLIVGTKASVENHGYYSQMSPKAILATLAAFEVRYDIPIVWSASPTEAAECVERWVWWFARELLINTDELRRSNNTESLCPKVS